MICAVVNGPTFEDAHRQIQEALKYANLVELRLDCFDHIDEASVKRLKLAYSIPMIFTLRSSLHGGHYVEPEETRLAEIEKLVSLNPEYLDVECDVPADFIKKIQLLKPLLKLIVSHHDFTQTPLDLDAVHQEMQKHPAYFYKIALKASNAQDALRFMAWSLHKKACQSQSKPQDGSEPSILSRLISVSMGESGQVSRILGTILGSPMTYVKIEDKLRSAPGQLSAKEMVETYRYRDLNVDTAIYGLIGDPVDMSIGAETHNHLMKTSGLNAVYVKLRVGEAELASFFELIRLLPFKGLSVTMPLKEAVIPYLDWIDPEASEIGAVNTLLFEDGKIKGFNTDGRGALNALESEYAVEGKRIILLGTGGAAKAIAYEACRRGGVVTIVGRSPHKALKIADRFGCRVVGWDDIGECMRKGYDILINCTPDPMPLGAEYIIPGALVMDIKTRPHEIPFLRHAMEKGCKIIQGHRMFVEQAVGQFEIWFQKRLDSCMIRDILEKKALEMTLP
jgi:3-dehydroquinate dehydratase/shikimate dehydrogenase